MTDQRVVVYTSDNCGQSQQLIDKLNEWQVSYEERNVSRNHAFIKELQESKIYGAPATFIGNNKILGFQEYKLKKTLGLEPDYVSRFKQQFVPAYKISGQ